MFKTTHASTVEIRSLYYTKRPMIERNEKKNPINVKGKCWQRWSRIGIDEFNFPYIIEHYKVGNLLHLNG